MAFDPPALSPRLSGGVFVEGWAQSYGSPYAIADDDAGAGDVELLEDGVLSAHPGIERAGFDTMAFVDGVRRGEASLYQVIDGNFVRGIAGAHACGAVIAEPGKRLRFDDVLVGRLVIWGSGTVSALPPVAGGWHWQPASIAGDDPQAPLADLQLRMRNAEGRLAEALADRGVLVIADGPLNFALRRDRPIVGYVKRHERAYLPRDQHVRVPELRAGERSTLFRIGDERFSCYLRLTDEAFGGPWAAIVRLEFSTWAGSDATRSLADILAHRLPRYAGLLHRDPRAPQNLQPIGALETHLRCHLGSEALAERAVREAVRYVRKAAA